MDKEGNKNKPNGTVESEYIRRVMNSDEIDSAFSLVDQEDWNLTYAKFKRLFKVFPFSIFITAKKDTGEVVAVVSAIPGKCGSYIIGNLVVKLDHQSRGLGKAMLQHVLKGLQDTSSDFCAILTAVPGTCEFYRKIGFQDVGPSHDVNYVRVDREAVRKACLEHDTQDVMISKYTPDMFQALNDYDKDARGYDCAMYLSVMMNCSDEILLATSKSSGQVVGFTAGVDQPSLLLVDGLYADTDGIALQLYSALLDVYPETQDTKIQEIKPRNFLSQFGDILPNSHQYTRMAVGHASPVCLDKLYVVCDCDYCE